MMNNPEIAKAIWKRQYDTDFALLDTPQEQIEFLKDLLLKNKENVIEAEKLPQFVPSDGQLTNQINDEFAPHKPTKKEWMKRWDEVNKELVLPVIMNQNHLSILEAEQELLISKLGNARKRLEVLPTYETHDVQKIPSISSEEKISSIIVESKHDDLDILLRNIAEKEPYLSGGKVWILLKKELSRNTRKYDKAGILLQTSSDDSDAIRWNSGRGKSNESRLTKDYLERDKWPAAKKWAKENPNKPS
jgi:hypothetical protein